MLAMDGMNGVPMSKRARRLNSINDLASADFIQEVSSVKVPDIGEVQVKVVKGDFSAVPVYCQEFIARYVRSFLLSYYLVPQCFDTVGWSSGRASMACKN